MKRHIFYLPVIVVIMLFTACNEDFLEVQPNDVFSNVDFWKTQDDALLAVNGIYNGIANQPYGGLLQWEDVATDDGFWVGNADASSASGWGGIGNCLEAAQGTASYSASMWVTAYKAIARCNVFLAKSKDIPMDDAYRKRLEGEAKFWRADMYHHLISRWGGVPLMTKDPSLEDPIPGRATYDDVLSQVYQDLNDAISGLPPSYPASDAGRITSWAAKAALVRVYLFNKDYDNAAKTAKDIIDNGPFILLPKFSDIWKWGNKNTQESILEVQFGDDKGAYGTDWRSGWYPSGSTYGWNGWGGHNTAQQQLVNEFELAFDDNGDGVIDRAEPFNPSVIREVFDEVQYKDRDPRLYESVWYKGADYFGEPYNPDWIPDQSGYNWRKYNTASRDEMTPFYYPHYNWILYRLAYVKLCYAEALIESASPNLAEAWTQLNDIRKRAGMPQLADNIKTDQALMRTAMRHEFRVEMAGEGHRLECLLRWKTFKEALENRHIANGRQHGTVKFEDFRYLRPIPKSELDANPTIRSQQNPGY